MLRRQLAASWGNLWRIRNMAASGGVLFLFRQEKYPKEADSGEALEREIYLTAYRVFPCYPDFKPPSPENPTRPLRVSEELRNRCWKIGVPIEHCTSECVGAAFRRPRSTMLRS